MPLDQELYDTIQGYDLDTIISELEKTLEYERTAFKYRVIQEKCLEFSWEGEVFYKVVQSNVTINPRLLFRLIRDRKIDSSIRKICAQHDMEHAYCFPKISDLSDGDFVDPRGMFESVGGKEIIAALEEYGYPVQQLLPNGDHKIINFGTNLSNNSYPVFKIVWHKYIFVNHALPFSNTIAQNILSRSLYLPG